MEAIWIILIVLAVLILIVIWLFNSLTSFNGCEGVKTPTFTFGYFNLLPMNTDGGELLKKSNSSNFLVLKNMISSLFI